MKTEHEDPRVSALKDRLLEPGLTETEINKIEKKLEILRDHE